MSRVITKTVFTFDELSDSAKSVARDWFRESALDHDWWDCTYSDAVECGKILGIDIAQKPVRLMNGGTRYDPAIYFSGFSSQGDGALFEGSYAYAKSCAKAIRAHAPNDETLRLLADELTALQRRYFYRLTAECRQAFHQYSHSGCMGIDASLNDRKVSSDAEESLRDILRSFADWIYSQLQAEYDYQMSDEQIDESIVCNEYEFDESGRRAS